MTDEAKALADHIRSDLTYITGLADHMEAGGDVSKKNIGDLIAIVRWNAEHHLECRDTIETQAREIERLRERLEIDPTHSMDGIYARDETIRGLDAQLAKYKALAETLAGALPDDIDLFRIIRAAGRSNAAKAQAVHAHLSEALREYKEARDA